MLVDFVTFMSGCHKPMIKPDDDDDDDDADADGLNHASTCINHVHGNLRPKNAGLLFLQGILLRITPGLASRSSKWLLSVVAKTGYNWDLNEHT